MKLDVRYTLTYGVVGTVLDGRESQRQHAVVEAQITMHIETDLNLWINLYPDVVEYNHDSESVEILVPMLSAEWIRIPFSLSENPRLYHACGTGEIQLRLVTATEDRVFRATHIASSRWLSADPSWAAPAVRERLLLQVGRDGVPSSHPNAAKVRSINEMADEHTIILKNLVLPARSRCIFCDATKPETREHAIPSWAKASGETGITVASCGICNNSLSPLESAVSDIARGEHQVLTQLDRSLVGMWAVKTVWVIGKALGHDLLRGSGDSYISGLLPAITEFPPSQGFVITDIVSSFEPGESLNFIMHTDIDMPKQWATLRVMDLVTSIWFGPERIGQ